MSTDLVKTVSEIGFRNGSSLIKYSNNPEVLRAVLSEGLFQALSLYSDVKPEAVQLMMSGILADYQYEPVEVIQEAIKDISSGKRKIYGRVTPTDIREVITEKLQQVARNREDKHQANKVDQSNRTSSGKSLKEFIQDNKFKK